MTDERTRRIRLCLDHLAVFLVHTGATTASFALNVDDEPVEVSYSMGMVSVNDSKGDPWSLPLELLRGSAPQVHGSPPDMPVDEDPPRRETGTYTVANAAGQVGDGRWVTFDALLAELHPLREDLQIVVVDGDAPRQLTSAEAIELGFALTRAQQAHAV